MVQFVPLKVDTGSPDWGQWARLYPPEGRGIPIIYIIRADGQMMYGKSGPVPGDNLSLFMQQHLTTAGRVLTDAEAKLLSETLESAKKVVDDDPQAAVKQINRLKKFGSLGELGSYAKPATEADQFIKQLTEQGKAALEKGKTMLAGTDTFEGVLAMVEAKRIYGMLPGLRTELVAAGRELNKDATLRDLLRQAEALDRARAYLALSTGKSRAVSALQLIVTRYPDTSASRLARQELEKLAVAVVDTPSAAPATSSGASDSGGAMSAADAGKRASSYLRMATVFAANRPEKARDYAQKVIDLVPGSDQAREAQRLLDRLR